jgi:hypothetical protein
LILETGAGTAYYLAGCVERLDGRPGLAVALAKYVLRAGRQTRIRESLPL